MNLRLRRRRFGQLVIASAATLAIGNLATKTLAQTEDSSSLLYGVSADSKGTGIVRQSFNSTTNAVQDLSALTLDLSLQSDILQPNERLSAFTVLPDGTFVTASAPTIAVITGNPVNLSKLIFTDTSSSPKILSELSGLAQNSTVESLLATNDDRLLSIVSLSQGSPPFILTNIDRQTGRVSLTNELDLQPNLRFSNLTQSPDGAIYATSLGPEGITRLVQIDLVNTSIITGRGKIITLASLSYNGVPLANDLFSLACSPANQLYALGDPTYEGTNSLFIVDVKTGDMKLLRRCDVDKIAFARS